jgi:NitT/TauT family transport system permease protein
MTTGGMTEGKSAAVRPRSSAWRPSRETIGGGLSILAFIVGWEIASFYAPPYAIPGWGRILAALVHIPPYDVGSMVLSFIVGLTISSLVFDRPMIEAIVMPLVRLLMAVPAVCWVVFAILWFKGVEPRIFFVMCVVCMPVFIVDSLDAMKGVPRDLRQMVDSFRPAPLQVFTKIILPSILPNLLTSWKINLTLAVRVVTIAELVGAVNGIGHGLELAQEMFSVADVFAWTVVLVAILFILQAIVAVTEHRTLRWRNA